MYLVFGGRISLLFFIGILASNCTVNKKPQTTFDNYIKDQNFNDRLSNYMLDIDELAKYQLGKRKKETDRLIFFNYSEFYDTSLSCEAIKTIPTDQLLELTFFSINSSYTFVLNEEEEYKATVWHNGSNDNPSVMRSYSKELKMIELYLKNDYNFMFQYDNCEYFNYVFGFKDNDLDVYKVEGDFINQVPRENLERSIQK